VHDAGGSEALGAIALTAYLTGQIGGGVAGGWLSDRTDRRRLLIWLCALALPAQLAATGLTPGSLGALAAAVAAGFLGMAILPPIVVMAQEILPHGAAVGSGIVMGLAWAAGSLGVLLTGLMADQVGALPATVGTMPVILVAVLLAAHPSLRASGYREA
jgi:FSR family fosmidomycin resistance protein-like MFS transporter